MPRQIQLLLVAFVIAGCSRSLPSLQRITVADDITFWAISAVDDKSAWVCGSKGTVGHTTDGGMTWTFGRIGGFEEREFRSVYAFDDRTAVVACVASPAIVLRTADAGQSWQQVYRNDRSEAFLDGIDFWNDSEGLVYGDPIDGRMFLLGTNDGGKSWTEFKEQSRPRLEKGEASFASSGTGIRCLPGGKVAIATGGLVSRLFTSDDKGASWVSSQPMLHQGSATGGIFSIAATDENTLLVGGDFVDSLVTELGLYRQANQSQWNTPVTQPSGTRWCVEYIGDNIAVAVGPSGGDITYDDGKTWQPLFTDEGFHVVRKSRSGNLVIAGGRKGNLALLR